LAAIKTMTRIFIFLNILFYSIQGISQVGSVEGKILYKPDSTYIPNVNIIVDGTRKGAATNTDGYFRIDSLHSGYHDFEIICIGVPIIRRENVLIEIDSTTIMNIGIPEGDCYSGKSKVCQIGNHTDSVIPIVYGLPREKLMKKADKGKVKLGGCLVTECDPKWYCKKHKKSF
jgi:hypothetical protein